MPHRPVVLLTLIFAGAVIVGLMVSNTVTMAAQLAAFPLTSVTVNIT